MPESELAGTDRIKAAVSLFYDRVVADPDLAPWFEGVDLVRLRAHMNAFLLAALGGPEIYAGRGIDVAHAGMHITDDAFDEAVAHLVHALKEVGMSDDVVSELRDRVAASRPLVVRG